jgi:Ni,Fe-hydrogenase III large subunit/Ni,Fe-hydrogenase III component G
MTRLVPPDTIVLARADLPGTADRLLRDGWRLALVAAHDDPDGFRVVYLFLRPVGGRTELIVPVPREDPWLPTLSALSFPAGRFEREIRDLYGIHPRGHPMPHRLVRHGHWPSGWHPMLRDADPDPAFDADTGSYPFLEVQGAGVYEIPVGPVHAGLIEPGHFRFSVVGETILRMKARLWFLHRGVEKLFEGRPPGDGIALAERISGDTAVAHTLAYATAVEDATGVRISRHTHLVRGLLLELERLYNHVNDLGAIANDVGFGIAHVHTQRLRERLLRHNQAVTGHRLLRGGITVGASHLRRLPDLDVVRGVADELREIVDITLHHSVVLDRFTGTAVLSGEQAQHLGTLGYVARASGLPIDARHDHPDDTDPAFVPVTQDAGDVLARFQVRAQEVAASAHLVRELTARLRSGIGPAVHRRPEPVGAPAPSRTPATAAGLGIVEAWRGTLTHRIELGQDGTLTRVKIVDPSFFNWPALPVALTDTIVPDFPLANKSFNQSYAGNDL